MIKKGKRDKGGSMLELWHPPNGAGEAVGCLATTYTFTPSLFDEQCLARFMEIESEPNREDLAYTLEKESRLGGIYAGVMVDYRQAGVEHSLRWDVLPVRIHAGKQHAKLSLLVWSHHIRLIVASANLSEAGYRSNFEVAAAIDFRPEDSDRPILGDTLYFLRRLLGFVSSSPQKLPEVERAERFLQSASDLSEGWVLRRSNGTVRQNLCFTAPASQNHPELSSLDSAVLGCRKRHGSPREMWIASPFFDLDEQFNRVSAHGCKLMARGARREAFLYVPCKAESESDAQIPRIEAPKSLWTTPAQYQTRTKVFALPAQDADKNMRPWHAKMLGLKADDYSALMIGSSNFTCAGMGVGFARNAEANLLTIVDRVAHSREVSAIEEVWPEGSFIPKPDEAEWCGAKAEDEDTAAQAPPVPAGFLSATYSAGDHRQITLFLDPEKLPAQWMVFANSQSAQEIVNHSKWQATGSSATFTAPWEPLIPPVKLLVRWGEDEAFFPINVEDASALPPPAEFRSMSAEQMLMILAATDPSAAFRAWARTQRTDEPFDEEFDSAEPPDLDPLRAHDLHATFLHRVRRRAKVLAQLRENLERPVASLSALEWKLRGLIGIEALAYRLAAEVATASSANEALLTLADLMVVISEVQYKPVNGSLSLATFNRAFRNFLSTLSVDLEQRISSAMPAASVEAVGFWKRILDRCRN